MIEETMRQLNTIPSDSKDSPGDGGVFYFEPIK